MSISAATSTGSILLGLSLSQTLIIAIVSSLAVFLFKTLRFIKEKPYGELKHSLNTFKYQERIQDLIDYLQVYKTSHLVSGIPKIIARKFNRDTKVFSYNIVKIIAIQFFIMLLFYCYIFLISSFDARLWVMSYIAVSSLSFTYHWLLFASLNITNTNPTRRIILFVIVLLLTIGTIEFVFNYAPTKNLLYIPFVVFILGYAILYLKTISLIKKNDKIRVRNFHRILYKLYSNANKKMENGNPPSK